MGIIHDRIPLVGYRFKIKPRQTLRAFTAKLPLQNPRGFRKKTLTLFGKTLVGLGRRIKRRRFSDKSDKAFGNIINILKANDYGKQTIGLHAQRA